ncbi:Uncharacterized protein LSUB1_G005409 [Lachnellula subtilissima]|uniref:Uncharacterized protein n=1 Tax=Lachnellula subtilissima TaxID=602034 RepID=A0A8H8RI21_9HELO|nr:Uncharacterized protein LSUB1_G005409 [Lachnellula subtilissima]
MKPVVGVMQAWSWSVSSFSPLLSPPSRNGSGSNKQTSRLMRTRYSIVVSVFAIVILSVIGALFKANNHSMVGTVEDPENGAAVAATVFSAVIVYASETERNREQYIGVRDTAWEGDREAFGVMRYVMDHSRPEWC